MKILLTGKNRSGKTTLLTKLLAPITDKKGFLTTEVRDDKDRIGFDLVDESGHTIALARTTVPTDFSVGRYFVDMASLDRYLVRMGDILPGQLLYIDEIGQMQLHSEEFKKCVMSYLNASNHFIGTITSIYEDNFVEQIKQQPDILTCEITTDNRQEIADGLSHALANRHMIDDFDSSIQQTLVTMATEYLEVDEYVYFKKLFKNAVLYLAEGRLQLQPDGSYVLIGETNSHHLLPAENKTFICDCDLFHGRGQFAGHKGLCSHIQTLQLSMLAARSRTAV